MNKNILILLFTISFLILLLLIYSCRSCTNISYQKSFATLGSKAYEKFDVPFYVYPQKSSGNTFKNFSQIIQNNLKNAREGNPCNSRYDCDVPMFQECLLAAGQNQAVCVTSIDNDCTVPGIC